MRASIVIRRDVLGPVASSRIEGAEEGIRDSQLRSTRIFHMISAVKLRSRDGDNSWRKPL
jgi:hypothetical protein